MSKVKISEANLRRESSSPFTYGVSPILTSAVEAGQGRRKWDEREQIRMIDQLGGSVSAF